LVFIIFDFSGDLSFGEVKLADVPAWIARRDKTPMGIYQGGVRSKFKIIYLLKLIIKIFI
jgi:hypothetical protein